MAEKISVEIALEGGQEVARQLADIGEAGQKAFQDIAQSAEQAGGFSKLDPGEVTAKLKAMGIEGTAAFDKITAAVNKAANLEKIVGGIQSVENAFVAMGRAAGPVGLAIAAGMQAATKATIAFADTLTKLSDQAVKLGLSFEQLKKQNKDFEKLGVSGKAAAEGFAKFRAELEKAAKADPGGQLAAFGLSTEAAQRQLAQFIEQLRRMPDSLARTNLAISQLGQAAGTQLIQGLRRAEGSMTDSEAKAYDLEQALQRLSTAWENLGSVQFAPAITAGINVITAAIDTLNQKLQQNPFMAWVQAASLLNPINAAVQLVISSVDGLIVKIGSVAWDTIASGATAAWNAVTQAVSAAGQAISTFVSSLAGFSWDAISSAGVAAWNAITGAIQGAIDALLKFIGLKPSAPATGGGAPGMARGGRVGGRGSGTSDSNLAWLSRGEYVTPAGIVRQPGVLAFLEAMRRGGGIPGYAAGGLVGDLGQLGQGLQQIARGIAQAAFAMHDAMLRVIDSISSATRALGDALAQSVEGINGVVQTLDRIGGNARGGLLGGRGTGTSDSNLAWVSRGEHIMPARAVMQPGVLAFLEALRRSGGNLGGVLDGMGRFALGGLVPRPAMAFAGGGPVGSAAHKNLGTLTLVTEHGIATGLVDSRIAEALQRAAVRGQVTSGGRKPSRYS